VESRYITLSDIRRLVIERIDFVVIDKKSQEDITRSILLQVIAEQEHGVEPLMSRDFLSHIIRSYGGATQGMIGSYLEQSLKLFAGQQRDARDRTKSGDTESAIPLNNLAQKNYQRWRQVQDEIYRTLLNAGRTGGRGELAEEEKSGVSYSHVVHD
jgi:polyhydroxyalkanoate synthesis repressor PhaR